MPARLLVCARDSRGPGPGQYRKGMVVVVAPDGHEWGHREPDSISRSAPNGQDFANAITFGCNDDAGRLGRRSRHQRRHCQCRVYLKKE